MPVKCVMLLVITSCTTEQALQPGVESEPITGFAVEACTRRIAQLAAPYNARGITSNVSEQAVLLPGDIYQLTFKVTVDYGTEKKTGRITCNVTASGRVESLEGMP